MKRESRKKPRDGKVISKAVEPVHDPARAVRLKAGDEKISRSLIEVMEEERRRISRDIHDELGQLATSIKMEVELLSDLGHDKAGLQTVCDSIRKKLDELLDSVSRISFALRPSILDDLGLIPAVESFLEKFQKASGIQCEWECDVRNSEYLPEVRITIYRILQEALTNVTRHAQTSTVKVGLYDEDGKLTLVIEDRGRGFDPFTIDAGRCLGLAGMRERAELAGGKLTVLSGRGFGTKVRMELPIETQREVIR